MWQSEEGACAKGYRTGYNSLFTAMVALFSTLSMSHDKILEVVRDSGLFTTSHGEPVPLSDGGLQRLIERSADAIAPHYEAMGQAAHLSPVAHIDGTTRRLFSLLG